jgi:hypothetical protein
MLWKISTKAAKIFAIFPIIGMITYCSITEKIEKRN